MDNSLNSLANALDGLGLEGQEGVVESAAVSNIAWSQKQLDVFEFVKSGSGNGVVEAVAGSGKTTTIVEALKYTDPNIRVAFVAFNKRIADELRERSPDHVHVSTLHSLGLRNIKRTFPKSKVDKNKMWKLFDVYEKKFSYRERELLKDNAAVILRLTSLLKMILLEPTNQNLSHIVDHYGVSINGQRDLIYTAAKKLWQMSLDAIGLSVNYDDMIFAPARGLTECEKFDFLFVDEAQDLNNAQIQFVLKSAKSTGRIVAVGDRMQSIYGFTGSDVDAIPNLIEALDATVMPLTITYRCPTSVVRLAQKFVPYLEAREGAPKGRVETIRLTQLFALVKEGDLVICRVNAPLVSPAFSLIRDNTKAIILGREIGKGLVNLIDRVGKRNSSANVVELLSHMRTYYRTEVAKLIAAKKNSRALALEDQFNTIIALANNCTEISEIKRKIGQVFADDRKGVTFSSIHKIKGGEAERVFILEPGNMPHPMARSDWERVQENNIIYVAYTRAKQELYLVE